MYQLIMVSNMQLQNGRVSALVLILTSVISILLTLGIVAIVISKYGVEEVATEVSPFVKSAKDRVMEGVVPPSAQTEPTTEADEIMDAVSKNQGSSVLLYREASMTGEFLGRGIVVSSTGHILTDATLIEASTTYSVAVPGIKERFQAMVVNVKGDIAVLKITTSTTLVSQFGNNFPTTNDMVVAITGDEKMRIGTGIVTDITSKSITTNIYGTITPGSPLVAKNGNVVGISLVGEQSAGEARFRLLTKDDINSLTKTVDGENGENVLD